MATLFLIICITLSVVISQNPDPNAIPGSDPLIPVLANVPCIMPACVNPCGEFDSWIGGTLQSRPHCQGNINTRCQGYAECNRGCYARYFDTVTGNEIFNCIIVYPPITPQPTMPQITPQPTPTPVMSFPNPNPNPNPQPQPQPVPWPNAIPAPSPYCPANLPSPGQACNSELSQADRCCQPGGPGSARCRFTEMNFLGGAQGICCIRNNADGCSRDSDCCNQDHICSYGICLKPLSTIRTNTNPLSNAVPIAPPPVTNPNTVPNTNNNPVEVPPISVADLAALGMGPSPPQPNAAVAADSLPLEIIGPEPITDDDNKHGIHGYGKYMSVGLTTGTMIWVSFVLLWLSLCSILYWFRKRPETYIDSIMDDTMMSSDTYDDHMLDITTPKLEPVPAEIDDL